MTGFTFNAPAVTEDLTIQNDGFFPDIKLEDVRKSVRLDGSVTNERLFDAIVNSILEINKELISLKSKANNLLALATSSVGGKADVEITYFRAVSSSVAATINENYRSYDSTGDGQKRAEELSPSIDDHRRNLRWAIRDLLDIPRCTVDLI
ncbi:head completion/stabilization protein [Acinetobacter bereziniae]|uniref:head completion/stabilization protein n=1 Tax=Acinetobacter bereziniae TaxID=106648 RepID=UPI003AF5A880